MAVALSGIRGISDERKACLSALFNATQQQQRLPHALVVSSLWCGRPEVKRAAGPPASRQVSRQQVQRLKHRRHL